MSDYTAPLQDMTFVLNDVLDAPATLAALPAHADIDSDLIAQVLAEAGRFTHEVLAPLNAVGDKAGCHFEQGSVTTPPGFAAAYQQFVEAGWPALACVPEYGGQGLPAILHTALYEMLSAANHAWGMYPGLLHGAYACLLQHADDALKERYLHRIVSGEWLATMCITEANAGSDLGLLRTRAVAQEDGSYQITGSKIFISGAEQDFTENIIHLVLARLPDAPAGSRGLSLFLVPKLLPDNTRNTVYCTGIEEKMGLHGSPTCSMQFDGATGWLIGTANLGLQAMFVMMNAARLHVGAQGLGLAEAAYQKALDYALERLQSRAPGVRANPQAAADPIILQPAVQRLLMNQRSFIEGGRMLAYWAGLMLDSADHDPDVQVRAQMQSRLGLMTPIIKAMLTTQGFYSTSEAIQVFGGHGYVSETGVEQYLRDVRITMVYEGSNEIQCIDFLVRKVLGDKGQALAALLDMVEDTARSEQQAAHNTAEGRHAAAVLEAVGTLRDHVSAIQEHTATCPGLPYQVASEMLRMTGHITTAWLWLRASAAARRKFGDNPRFYQGKLETACYYFTYLFPEVQSLSAIVKANLYHASHEIAFPLATDLNIQHACQKAG